MKKFLKQYNAVLEQDEAELPVEEPVPVPELQPETETLSPESEVLLVRLIKKALVTEIDAIDVDLLSELSDINEINAKSSLQILINIMKKYSQDIDIG